MYTLKLNKKKGIVYWITGLSGSGKTQIGHKIKNDINHYKQSKFNEF